MNLRNSLLVALAFMVALSAGVRAQSTFGSTPYPVPYFSWADPGNLTSSMNMLIQRMDNILSPLQPSVQDNAGVQATNKIALIPGLTGGSGPTIGLQAGSDTNRSITILPNGSGNIILWGVTGARNAGLLKFSTFASFINAPRLAACPASMPAVFAPPSSLVGVSGVPASAMGIHSTVQGFIPVKDWLDRVRYIPTC